MKSKKLARYVSVAAVIAMSAACGTATSETRSMDGEFCAEGDSVRLRLTTTATEEQALGKVWTHFAETVEELTCGQATVENYTAGSLYGEAPGIEAALNGSIDLATAGTSSFSSFTQAFVPFDLPFVLQSDEDAAMLWSSPVGEQVAAEVAEDGLTSVAFVPIGGPRSIFTKDKQVKSPEDLKGMKIRTAPSEVDQAVFTCWGAIATPISFPEVYTALQQGVVDGEAPQWDFYAGAQHQEVTDYAVEVDYQVTSVVAALSTKKFQSLPRNVQEALLAAGESAQEYGIELSAESVTAAKSAAADKDVTIYTPTQDERDEWAECGPVSWAATDVDTDRVEQIKAELAR